MRRLSAVLLLVLLLGALSGCSRDNRGDFPVNDGNAAMASVSALV